jgi:hypothetical protein
MQALDVVDQIDDAVEEQIEDILDNKPEPAQNWRR